ncbi:MAG: holo-ACP synthase [Bacteroidetes bacterium]|nr:holo-ACP synthase [Bacteroidota bacterium]MBK8145802.1 holo-ACP synthase [Bacteroidota bacterium]MBP6315351.1 holo-ACP synthase [Chitinophagaceae bacterium]
MIQGIGTDIVEVKRIAEKLSKNEDFKRHVFSEAEIIYCEKQKFPSIHFAARWAVKEAYLKAFGLKFIGNHRLYEIETIHNEEGKPFISLSGLSLQQHEEKQLGGIHLSISHTHEHAVAYVLIEEK